MNRIYLFGKFFSFSDTNFINKSPKGNRTTINGKKKCEEQQTVVNKTTDETPPPPKRLVRAFPRYKVIGDKEERITDRSVKNAKANSIVKHVEVNLTKQQQLDDEKDRDPITGLIVKFKRVRESELTKLTYEADNFMFPKQRDEVLTDDDRQSTSERDISSEVLSSEIGSPHESLSSSNNTSLNVSVTSDQYTSSGRRKKRRAQYDSFKSPPEPQQKFRTSLIQSR